MIIANKNEQFSDVFIFYDLTGHFITNYTASYIIADAFTDVIVTSGVMSEYDSGVHVLVDSLNTSGDYICYATCSGALINTEIKILSESIYDLIKSKRNYNQSYENILRDNSGSPNASQIFRKVPEGETDYIIHKVKEDFNNDWSTPTASGNSYAYYRGNLPYKVERII
jgi:hypothetical protein